MEQSLVGEAYVANFRKACRQRGIRIVAEASIAQTAQDVSQAVHTLYDAKAQAIVHAGFGFGIVFVNPALAELDWDPPRFAGHRLRERLDQSRDVECVHGLDRHRPVRRGQSGGPAIPRRIQGENRPATGMVCARGQSRCRGRDAARVVDAHPLSPRGVKEALERVKSVPAASGAPGTRISFGNWTGRGWMGSGYLVARRAGTRRCQLASRRPFRRGMTGQPPPEQVNAWAVEHVQGADAAGDGHHQQRCGPLDLGSLNPRSAECRCCAVRFHVGGRAERSRSGCGPVRKSSAQRHLLVVGMELRGRAGSGYRRSAPIRQSSRKEAR